MFNNGDLYNPRFRLDWNLYTLYSLAEWINGKAFRKTDYSEKGYPVIKIAELNRGIDENTQYASKDKFDEKFQIKKSDILFAWSGNPKTSINSFRYTYESGWLNQHIFKVIPKENIDKNYLYYLLKYLNPNFEMIASNKQTTGLGHVTKNDLKNIQVRIPKISDQIIISEVLSSFDNKIENNNAIIANLEEQAQTIFKSWFVDFEPFQEDEFVESELGNIPVGWEVVRFDELIDFKNGYSFKGKELNNEPFHTDDLKVFKMGDIKVGGGINPGKTKSWVTREYVQKNKLERFIGEKGLLLMCMTDMKNNVRLLGHTALINSSDEYIINQRVGMIKPKLHSGITSSYLYILTNNDEFLSDLRSRANSGVQVNLSTTEIKSSQVILPPSNVLNHYNKISENLINLRFNLVKQNQKLEQIRDTLLPKLMSGEIRVEKAIESQ